MPYGAVGRYTEPTIVPPDIQDKYQDYNVFDLARELGQHWLGDLQKSMKLDFGEFSQPVAERQEDIRGLPKSYQRYEEKRKPSTSERVASAIMLTEAVPEHMARGMWEVLKEYKKSLPEMIKEPEKYANKWTELLIDVGVKPSFVNTVQPNVLATLGGVKGAKALGKLATKAERTPFKKAILDTHRGVSAEKVWKETGWTKDPSGKWMFRIDDSDMKIKTDPDLLNKYRKRGHKFVIDDLENVIEHPKLFKAYPWLKKVEVQFDLEGIPTGASWNKDRIKLEGAHLATATGEARGSLIHEINHAVAEKEGLVKGGISPGRVADYAPVWDDVKKQWAHPSFEDARRRYTNAAGEIYAREEAVGFKGMPGTMEKIPRKDWIIRK